MPSDSAHPIEYGPVTAKNVGTLKILNTAIFPVNYADRFYADLLLPSRDELSRLAFYNDVVVGAVCCRIETKAEVDVSSLDPSQHHQGTRAYIMTLGVLAPYRQLGIGTALLQHILDTVPRKFPSVEEIYLHVQTSNEAALVFYSKFGFSVTETIKDYYKRIEPPDCYVLTKKVVKRVPV